MPIGKAGGSSSNQPIRQTSSDKTESKDQDVKAEKKFGRGFKLTQMKGGGAKKFSGMMGKKTPTPEGSSLKARVNQAKGRHHNLDAVKEYNTFKASGGAVPKELTEGKSGAELDDITDKYSTKMAEIAPYAKGINTDTTFARATIQMDILEQDPSIGTKTEKIVKDGKDVKKVEVTFGEVDKLNINEKFFDSPEFAKLMDQKDGKRITHDDKQTVLNAYAQFLAHES